MTAAAAIGGASSVLFIGVVLMRIGRIVRAPACLALVAAPLLAIPQQLPDATQSVTPPKPVLPTPADEIGVAYGPHPRNVLDFWRAESSGPTPLIVFIHGGGFRQGGRAQVPASLVDRARAAGISVASVDYRLTDTASFPAPMLDGARAIQFLRTKAEQWNLDASRFAAAGTSAGGGISLWVAFHDDLARRDSADPVERESSRLTCAGGYGVQTSYDPRFIRARIGGSAISHTALLAFYGLTRDQFDLPEAHVLFEDASPLTYVSGDDPPVFLYYVRRPAVPLPADADENDVIHHAEFGDALRERMEALGLRAEVRIATGTGLTRKDWVYGDLLLRLQDCLHRSASRRHRSRGIS